MKCPALVLHGRGDLRIPFEEGRLVAGLIPGASFVTLETRNHLMMQDEPAWRQFLEALTAFYPPREQARAASFPALPSFLSQPTPAAPAAAGPDVTRNGL